MWDIFKTKRVSWKLSIYGNINFFSARTADGRTHKFIKQDWLQEDYSYRGVKRWYLHGRTVSSLMRNVGKYGIIISKDKKAIMPIQLHLYKSEGITLSKIIVKEYKYFKPSRPSYDSKAGFTLTENVEVI